MMANGLSLEDAYGATLGRIRAQGGERSRLGIMALMWICHSERPLEADELRHALGVEIGSTDFDPDNVPSIRTVLSCCQGLVVVDKEGSTVRLVHFTLREYLSGRPDLFQRPHSVIAETCLTYLNSQQVMNLSATQFHDNRAVPFLKYSALHWGTHGKKELSDNAKSLALKLLGQYDDHVSIRLLLESLDIYQSRDYSLFTGLHCASFFGLVEVVRSLIERGGFDINQGSPMGITPLGWAARGGHEEVVQLLLGWGNVKPDLSDRCDLTPLGHAAENGHEGVVRLLLGRGDVRPDRLDWLCRTALAHAAMNGHEGVVRVLLGREDVNPDKPDNSNRAPLAYAAMNGHEGVVRVLLGREDVNPDKPDNLNRAPLAYAAMNGHEGVVRVLLGRVDVNPDKPDNSNRAPLAYAARNGHEGVVQLLLGRGGVNPDRRDRSSLTPLSYAINSGHGGVVKLILDWKSSRPPLPQPSEA